MKILGICGSLRSGSFNNLLLAAATEVASDAGATVVRFDIGGLPFYNADLDNDSKPAPVAALIEAIAAADGLLVATPEYNYGVPGVLKNALDWASRPAYKSVLANKPTAIISASMSAIGGARAQAQLRAILAGTLTPVFLAPDFLLPLAQKAFDDQGALRDSQAIGRLDQYIKAYLAWLATPAKEQ